MASADTAPYWVLAPRRFDQAILTLIGSLPDKRRDFPLVIMLRRAVTMRLAYPKIDVEGFENVFLRPFFQDVNVVAAPRHHRRRAWKLENRPHFDNAGATR